MKHLANCSALHTSMGGKHVLQAEVREEELSGYLQ